MTTETILGMVINIMPCSFCHRQGIACVKSVNRTPLPLIKDTRQNTDTAQDQRGPWFLH